MSRRSQIETMMSRAGEIQHESGQDRRHGGGAEPRLAEPGKEAHHGGAASLSARSCNGAASDT
jgi:hypothetical protein